MRALFIDINSTHMIRLGEVQEELTLLLCALNTATGTRLPSPLFLMWLPVVGWKGCWRTDEKSSDRESSVKHHGEIRQTYSAWAMSNVGIACTTMLTIQNRKYKAARNDTIGESLCPRKAGSVAAILTKWKVATHNVVIHKAAECLEPL